MRDEEYKTLVNWIENALGRYYENDDGTIEISGGDFRYIVDIKNPSITMVCELSGKDRFGKHKIIPVEHGWRAKDYIDVLRDITSNDTLKRSIFKEKTNMKDMSLLEAIEILNKNGFVCELPKTLKEAYDAVTDHQRTKANRYEDYDCNITKSLQRMLREEGYTVSIKYSDEITVSKSRKERYKVTLVTHGTYGATDYNYSKGNDIGAESETRSAHVYHEETVEINVKGIDYNVNFGSEEFDIRDLPGIVAYIIDCIETY